MLSRNRTLHLVSCLLACATVFLLIAGALVTGTGSGLSVPDWPLSFGTLFPEMTGGVFYEHGHRLIAGAVAVATLVQLFLYLRWEPRGWVRGLAAVSFALVIIQAMLGGLTVLLRLPPQVSVAHACLAQLFFCSVVTLAFVTSRSWSKPAFSSEEAKRGTGIAWAAWALTGGFFVQLLFGAIMRHNGAGLAIPDFPLVFGGLVPSEFGDGVLIHFLHRMMGYLLVVVSSVLVMVVFKRFVSQLELIMWGGGLLTLLSIQVMLGANIILLKRPVAITSAHLAVGALCFATSLILSLKLSRLAWKWRLAPSFQTTPVLT